MVVNIFLIRSKLLFDACPRRQPKNHFFFFDRTSMKKMHDTVCCYFPISTKKSLKMYFTELYYHVVFSKLLYFNEEV